MGQQNSAASLFMTGGRPVLIEVQSLNVGEVAISPSAKVRPGDVCVLWSPYVRSSGLFSITNHAGGATWKQLWGGGRPWRSATNFMQVAVCNGLQAADLDGFNVSGHNERLLAFFLAAGPLKAFDANPSSYGTALQGPPNTMSVARHAEAAHMLSLLAARTDQGALTGLTISTPFSKFIEDNPGIFGTAAALALAANYTSNAPITWDGIPGTEDNIQIVLQFGPGA